MLPPTVSNYFALATGLSLFTKNTSLGRKVDKNVRRGMQGLFFFTQIWPSFEKINDVNPPFTCFIAD